MSTNNSHIGTLSIIGRCCSVFPKQGITSQSRVYPNNHIMVVQLGSRDHWIYSKSTCYIYKQLWLFEGSRLPFHIILLFMYSWWQQHTSIEFCKKELDMNYGTRVEWANYLKEVWTSFFLQYPKKIGSPNVTVEVDETQQKNHQGRHYPQQWVFRKYCCQTKETFLWAREDWSVSTLLLLIEKYVHPGYTI